MTSRIGIREAGVTLSIETEEQASALREFLAVLQDVLECDLGGDYVAASVNCYVLDGFAADRRKLDELCERMSVAKRGLLQAGFSMPTDWLVQWPPDLTIDEGDLIIRVTATVDERMKRIAEEAEALLLRWEAVGKVCTEPLPGRHRCPRQRKVEVEDVEKIVSDKVWLNLTEAAEYLAISGKQLRNRCKKKMIVFRREGQRGRGGVGEYRFRREWLDEYLHKNTCPQTNQAPPRHPEAPRQRKVRRKVHVPESEWGSSLES